MNDFDFLRTYAIVGARLRLTEIDEERAQILRRFPELATSLPEVAPALVEPERKRKTKAFVTAVRRKTPSIVFTDAVDQNTALLEHARSFVVGGGHASLASVMKQFKVSKSTAKKWISDAVKAGLIHNTAPRYGGRPGVYVPTEKHK